MADKEGIQKSTEPSYEPYIVTHRGPEPLLDPNQRADIMDSSWSKGLPPYERLYKHTTISTARHRATYKTPKQCPKDDLDFVLDSVFTPLANEFPEKPDVYIQLETVFDSKPNFQSWRLLRNRQLIQPLVEMKRDHPMVKGGIKEKVSVHQVKLGIPSPHSPQTNGGYSRTPIGSFYCI